MNIDNQNNMKISTIIKAWKKWDISNFKFLMWLNILGNRSYNDISQYPIFPWPLTNYKDPLFIEDTVKQTKKGGKSSNSIQYRDMSLSLGMMELSEECKMRKKEFIESYNTLLDEPDEVMKPYFFGSNYSNPIYVCNFLIRVFPFTHIAIELQGKKFDDPNRLFLSVDNSFKNSTSQKTDLRELIPEFFYCPEMFRNMNSLNLGSLENGDLVSDCITPCDDNPYNFVITMKTIIENEYISSNIQNWIDLIFGYKSRGKEAETAKNIYTEASYQENIDLSKIEEKASYLRMVEFGLIPTQVMYKECIKKEKLENVKKKQISIMGLRMYKSYKSNEKQVNLGTKSKIVKVGIAYPGKIFLFVNNSNTLIYSDIQMSYSAINKKYAREQNIGIFSNYGYRMAQFYNSKTYKDKIIRFLPEREPRPNRYKSIS